MAKPASKATTGPAASRGAHRAPLAKAPVVKTSTLEQTTRSTQSSSLLSVAGGASGAADAPGSGVPQAVRRLNGGAPLPRSIRERMEASFGRPFDGVRVHTDAAGSELAESVGAEAVTVGEQIAFAPAAFRPETASGDHLIAHELAHVAQGAAQARGLHSESSEPAELAAEQAASAVSRGENVRLPVGSLGAPSGEASSMGVLSTRSRLMRRARAGALPSLTVSTPVPGEGAIGRKKRGLEPEEQAQAEAEAEATEQSGVFQRRAPATPTPPESPGGGDGAGASSSSGAGPGAPGDEALVEARREELDREQRERDPLDQGRASLDAAHQSQAVDDKKREEQGAEGATKAREQQAANRNTQAPAPGSPAAEASTAVVEATEAAAPSPEPEAIAADVAKDDAEVEESEGEAEAQETVAAEATPDSGDAPPEDEPAPATPEADPAFTAVVSQAQSVSFQQGHNTAADRKVAEMQEAVADPPGAAEATAKGAHVAGPMAAAEPAPFDKASFEAAVLQAIAGVEPASQEQAKTYRVPGSVGSVVSAATSSAKSAAAGPVAGAAAATPSAAGVVTQAGGAVPAMPPGPVPGLPAEGAAPKPRSESQVEDPLRQPGKDFDKKLEESGFKEETFTNSNEPGLSSVLTERDGAKQKTEETIEANRASETVRIDDAQAGATNVAQAGTGAMHDTRARQFGAIVGDQEGGKSKEEQAREEIKQKLDEIYERSKQKVDDKLKEVDTQVNAEFERGLAAAISAYQTYTEAEVGSTLNFLTNLFDWTEFKNRVYGEGKRRWQGVMRNTISTIAGIVAIGLNQAFQFARDGAQEARTWFEKQPAEKQKLGAEALEEIQGKFDDLKSTVEAHGAALVNQLADKYKTAAKDLDNRIEADKQKNLSLWEQAAQLLDEGLKVLEQLKEMLLGIASGASDVVGQILTDPIGFLSTLIAGVQGGLSGFVQRIGGYLQQGLMTWLLGQLPPGVELPESFDLKGIITLGLQILGATYQRFRARAVAMVGEPIVQALETAAEVFQVFLREGASGLFRFIEGQLGELKGMVLGAITDLVTNEVVKAGISFVLGLMSPAGALIKAVKMIIDIVTFFVTRGSQIAQLVQAVIGSLAAIASGNSAALAKAIEGALASAIPVVLGFLASLAGLGNIPQKIQGILEKIRAPIDKAINFVIGLAVKLAKAAGKLFTGAFGKKKPEEKPAQSDEDPEKQAKVDAGLLALDQEDARFAEGGKIEREEAERVATTVKGKHPVFKSISVVDGGETWDFDYVASPTKKKRGLLQEEGGRVQIEFSKFNNRLKFSDATKEEMRKRFPDAHQPGSTTLLPGFDRRHIVAFSTLRDQFGLEINGKTIKLAAQALAARGRAPSAETIEAIEEAVGAELQHLFNNPKNLFVGGAEENQALGRDIATHKRERDRLDPEKEPEKFDETSKKLATAEVDVGPSNDAGAETSQDTIAMGTVDQVEGRLPRHLTLADEADQVNRGLAAPSMRLRRATEDQNSLTQANQHLGENVRARRPDVRSRMQAALTRGVRIARRLGEVLATKR